MLTNGIIGILTLYMQQGLIEGITWDDIKDLQILSGDEKILTLQYIHTTICENCTDDIIVAIERYIF